MGLRSAKGVNRFPTYENVGLNGKSDESLIFLNLSNSSIAIATTRSIVTSWLSEFFGEGFVLLLRWIFSCGSRWELSRPDPASLGDTPAPTPKSEHRQVTVLIADLVGYTPFVERAGGEAAYTLMSHLSGLMTASVHHHRGSVMSYTGDGIIALFGAPVALEDGKVSEGGGNAV